MIFVILSLSKDRLWRNTALSSAPPRLRRWRIHPPS